MDQISFNRSKDPSKPDWITVSGTSKLEGYHPHLEGTLPGTLPGIGYAPDSAGGIFSLFNMQWSVKRGIQSIGDPDSVPCSKQDNWVSTLLVLVVVVALPR